MSTPSLEETILLEIADLSEPRRADVLAYIRFLKVGLADKKVIEMRFKSALVEARAEAKKRRIKPKSIENEIRAVRAGNRATG